MKIMNCVFSMTSTILIILLGIQAVSHSQYYPSNDDERSLSSSLIRQNAPASFFNTRNFEPPYRQHQHHYHIYNDPSGGTTVRYYGTQPGDTPTPQTTDTYDAEVLKMEKVGQETSLASYRRSYNGRSFLPTTTEFEQSHFNQFETPRGIGITVRDDGDMDIFIGDPERPNRKPDIFRIKSGRRQQFSAPSEFDASSIERPPETLVVVIHRPSFSSTTFAQCERADHRINREDGKCYQLGTVSPCGPNSLMRFYPDKDNKKYGDCDCLINNGEVSRPLVYWRPHNRCYLLYHRGPCQYNEWLILDNNSIPRCSPQKCAHSLNEEGKYREFWFLHRGTCYKTGQHYPRFCGIDQEDWKVWFPLGESEPKCMSSEPVLSPNLRTLLSSVGDLPCKPGHKKMQNGVCKRIARYDDDY